MFTGERNFGHLKLLCRKLFKWGQSRLLNESGSCISVNLEPETRTTWLRAKWRAKQNLSLHMLFPEADSVLTTEKTNTFSSHAPSNTKKRVSFTSWKASWFFTKWHQRNSCRNHLFKDSETLQFRLVIFSFSRFHTPQYLRLQRIWFYL